MWLPFPCTWPRRHRYAVTGSRLRTAQPVAGSGLSCSTPRPWVTGPSFSRPTLFTGRHTLGGVHTAQGRAAGLSHPIWLWSVQTWVILKYEGYAILDKYRFLPDFRGAYSLPDSNDFFHLADTWHEQVAESLVFFNNFFVSCCILRTLPKEICLQVTGQQSNPFWEVPGICVCRVQPCSYLERHKVSPLFTRRFTLSSDILYI